MGLILKGENHISSYTNELRFEITFEIIWFVGKLVYPGVTYKRFQNKLI